MKIHLQISNQRSKQTNFAYLQFLSSYALFSKNCGGKFLNLKDVTSNMKVYYKTPRNYQLTGHPENFKFKLFNFQEIFHFVSHFIFPP